VKKGIFAVRYPILSFAIISYHRSHTIKETCVDPLKRQDRSHSMAVEAAALPFLPSLRIHNEYEIPILQPQKASLRLSANRIEIIRRCDGNHSDLKKSSAKVLFPRADDTGRFQVEKKLLPALRRHQERFWRRFPLSQVLFPAYT